MTGEAFDAACLALPGAEVSVQWGDDRVYKVGGKMFAVLGPDGSCSFKTNDIAYEMLTTEGPGRPAPYLARARWVRLESTEALPEEDLRAYLSHAHVMVAGKLTRAQRSAMGLN